MAGAVLVLIAAVAGVAAAADRLLALAVGHVAGRRVAAVAGAPSRPLVRIVGGPFLTQMLAGRYRQVLVTLAAFTAAGVEFSCLTATLTGVRAPIRRLRSGAGAVASLVEITATIPLAVIDRRLPAGLIVRHERGALTVRGSVLRVPVSGTLRIDASRQVIGIVPRVLGVPSLVGFEIAMPAMPPQLVIDAVSATDSGLTVMLRGERVILGGPTGPTEPDRGIAR